MSAESFGPKEIPDEIEPSNEARPVPTPEGLLMEAEQEIDKKALDGYGEVIKTLRETKNFSYREIAEWLSERGVPSDHNSVYRAYMKGLTRLQRMHVQEQDDLDAMEEAREEENEI